MTIQLHTDPAVLVTVTRRDPDLTLAVDAVANLRQARDLRARRHALLLAAIDAYGDVQGTPTSGCYNPGFPEDVKDELRYLARQIGQLHDASLRAWRASGRRDVTWHAFAPDFRRLADGTVSYY